MSGLDGIRAAVEQNIALANELAPLIREAGQEIIRLRAVVESYRTKDAAHERIIGELYQLLAADRSDDAFDIVRDEYRAIHGPST